MKQLNFKLKLPFSLFWKVKYNKIKVKTVNMKLKKAFWNETLYNEIEKKL